MKRMPRAGVIGAGYWGANLVRNCYELGVLTAVCDSDLRRLDEVRSKYSGVALYMDPEQMLQNGKVDAVVIAAPAAAHAELALQAIAAGKHVFVEKPLALSVEDAQRVVEAAEAANVTLFVGHVLLYHPAVSALIEAAHSGKIGHVRHLRSRRLSWGRLRAQENVWWSFAPHDCALMLAIMRDSPVNATGWISEFVRPGVGDFAYADFAFADGRSAHIEVSWLDPDKRSRIDVFGSEGTLTFIDSREGGTLTLTPCGDRLNTRGEPELWKGEPQQIVCPRDAEPLRLELQAFIRALRAGGRFPTDGREGLEVVRALQMVDSSATVHSFTLEALA
ncbi:MAG TPA: Gfo/Idh/MocA family oxidoreductase [Candidatus Baltobacteraceae bacterium]|jgi:UDP-2-acetamido-3-amino-2,3-dideoxy-glucuronate N-acetyltransferase|nr:Gfo/Idh/MocA family oxidoreductase [Candidatus Baltobacteraceae bacterium]